MFEFIKKTIIKYVIIGLLNILFFIDWLCPAQSKPKKTKAQLEELARKELDEWKIDMYANNRNLFNIPNIRLNKKRSEIRKKYGLE